LVDIEKKTTSILLRPDAHSPYPQSRFSRMSYESIVKQLPVPSWDQSERFARYLSAAHSWYKLPVERTRPFFLFLDPAAGCEPVNWENKGFRPVEITRHDRPMHGLQTTGEYRERFGFWSYKQTPEGFGIVEPPEVRLSDGSRVLLPDDWKDAGLTALDAFVHPDSPLDYIGGWDRFTMERWPSESIFDRMQLCLQERLAGRPRLKELLEEQIPAAFRAALKPPDDAIGMSFRGPAYGWPDEQWKQQLLALQIPQNNWSPLCKYFELLAHERRLASLPPLPSSREFPDGFFVMALAEERVLQLTRLTDAMSSFLLKLAQTSGGGSVPA
jgi:hypothetical protein